MSQTAGYFVVLTSNRYFSLKNRADRIFAEPVPEFLHSRNTPLICFVLDNNKIITHVGLGKRGVRAGTDLRRLNVDQIIELKTTLSAREIANSTSSTVRRHLVNKLESGGLIPPKSFDEFLDAVLKKTGELSSLLEKFARARRFRIAKLSSKAKKSLAEQKEAVLTAMNIAGIDRSEAQGWDYSEKTGPTSFLDGLEQVMLREDSMIINDLNNIPGFNLIKQTKFSSSIFLNDKTQLTVLLANRMPLEELLGTDLIYYNEDFKCFIMVQYKVMEKEKDQFLLRVPNSQLAEEIQRMDLITHSLAPISGGKHIDDFRISSAPFFIKMCPRIEFNPDNIGLSAGMYVPLGYLKLLQVDNSIKGDKGGMAISYDNVGRYFDNTTFKTIVEGGWIGTYIEQSKILEKIIQQILANGRTAVVAIKKKIQQSRSLNDDFKENKGDNTELIDPLNDDIPF
jgi:hypothetical protein